MFKYISLCINLLFLSPLVSNAQSTINTIPIEKTEYGLIFTDIQINGKTVKAMVDYGDQHALILSSTLVKQLHIKTNKAYYQSSDIYGNVVDVYTGTVENITIGNKLENSMNFAMQYDDIEAISKQVGTDFQAIIGMGYFNDYYTEIDYGNNQFILHKNLDKKDKYKFSLPYLKDANQLIFDVTYKQGKLRAMLDTGASVSAADTSICDDSSENCPFQFTLNNTPIEITVYPVDLSVLADLGVKVMLGTDFLNLYKITVDSKEGKLYFR